MAVNLKIVSQVVVSGTPGPAGKSTYQIAVDNGFQGTESEWLKELHPFKGWFDSVSELEEEHSAPSVGEYAYVKGATSSDPVKIYECSTEGSWSDSGRTVDTSGVQTFGSGEDVNDVNITGNISDIVENSEKLPTAGAVAIALGLAKFSTGEKIKDVGIDDEPTGESENLVKSGGVYKEIRSIVDSLDTLNSDLDFSDENGNVLVRFSGGHIKTKNFDSEKVGLKTEDDGVGDFDVSDENGNVLVRFSGGHIKTKNFDSKNIDNVTYEIAPQYQTKFEEVVNTINNLHSPTNSALPVTFIVFTDCHNNSGHPEFERMLNVIRGIVSETNSITFVANLGDTINGATEALKSRYTYMVSKENELRLPYVNIIGNHDNWTTSFSIKEMINPKYLQGSNFSPRSAAFYLDDNIANIRYIFINCCERGDCWETGLANPEQNYAGISYSQLNWLANTALKTKKKVVIVSHETFTKNVTYWMSNTYSNYMKIKDVLQAFVGGTSGTINLTLQNDASDAQNIIQYNFTEQGAGEIICSVHGHIHGDASENNGTWREIWVDNALCDTSHFAGTDNPKIINTINEIAFDVITIDRYSRKIYCTRFGTGSNREFNY